MRLLRIVAIAPVLAACSLADRATDTSSEHGSATVTHPIDGDTIEVRVGGTTERVRLIGIDTPESGARDRPIECYGVEAKDRMAALLPPGTAVRLERDVEARDKYGRLLAYVFRADDGVHVNLLLVEEGFAEARPFAPNVTRQAELDRAERDARAANRGLWPVCGGTDLPVGGPPG
ncbi:MAG: thermonuclease family protein [Microthrixaceae bacterium]